MKTVKKHLFGAIVPLFFCWGMYCQNGTVKNIDPSKPAKFNGNGVEVPVGGNAVFTSAIAGKKYPLSQDSYTVDDMYYIDILDLFRLSKANIKGSIDGGGITPTSKIVLKVYAYNYDNNSGKGKLIYQLEKNANEDGNGHPVSMTSGFIDNYFNPLFSDDIKTLLSGVQVRDKSGNSIIYSSKQVLNAIELFATRADLEDNDTFDDNYVGRQSRDIITKTNGKIPVIIEVEVTNATVKEITVPGLNKPINLVTFNPNNHLIVDAFLNDNSNLFYKYISGSSTSFTPKLIKMGDKMTYKVHLEVPISDDNPEIIGVPGVWLANFGAESMYYCSPSVTPGEFSPWIGFDSNVHGSALFKYPTNENFDYQIFKKNVPDWENSLQYVSTKIWTWSWTAQREMDPLKSDYKPVYEYKRTKKLKDQILTLPDGTITDRQINNQREGLGMELLRTWKNYSIHSARFKEYDGENKYLTGLDTDEVVYLNSQDPDLQSNEKRPNGIIRQNYDYWKFKVETQDSIAIHNMVTAYRRNREALRDNKTYDYSKIYDGYEIQDLGTDEKHPNGNGSGNNKAPGRITIKKDGYRVDIPIQVDSPFNENKGFYGNITGTQWPTVGEEEVFYTLSGLKDLTSDELDKFSLVLRSQNTSGVVFDRIQKLSALSGPDKEKIRNSGKWSQKFSFKGLGGTGYYTITAFYQRDTSAEPVMVAGKELLETKLRFTSAGNRDPKNEDEKDDVTLDEGRGDGAYIYDDEYRDAEIKDFNLKKFQKYIKKYNHTYTFKVGSTVKFSSMDSDPHTFYHDGIDYYLSERTLAKRIPLDTLSKKDYLAYYIDPIDSNGVVNLSPDPVGNGVNFRKTFDKIGQYQLRVVYRNKGKEADENYVFHKINVVKYTGPDKANVGYRSLTSDEIKYLGLSVLDAKDLIVGEIKDVLSTFMYKDGLRAGDYKNRFEKFNNYSNSYVWKIDKPGNSSMVNHDKIQNWITNYNSYEWFPKTWVRHIDPGPVNDIIHKENETPLATENDYLAVNVFKAPELVESWQIRLPWMHITKTSGTRIRTNIKAIYDLNKFFDNENGAFSGNPILPKQADISFHLRTDDHLNKEELYWDLKTGRKIIFDKKVYPITTSYTRVFNSNSNPNDDEIVYYAQALIDQNQNTVSPAAKQALNQQSPAPKTKGLVVYPNPNVGKFNVSWENPNDGEVSITLFSLNGAAVFSKKEQVPAGKNTGIFDTGSALPTGVYVLKIVGNGFDSTTKVSIKSD